MTDYKDHCLPAFVEKTVCIIKGKEWNGLIILSTFIFLHFVAAHRGHTDTVTDSTVKHNIPAEQEELIHLQEQVKNGAISVDEALERFKQWQNEKQRLQSTQQVWVWNVCFLMGTLIRSSKNKLLYFGSYMWGQK